MFTVMLSSWRGKGRRRYRRQDHLQNAVQEVLRHLVQHRQHGNVGLASSRGRANEQIFTCVVRRLKHCRL